VNNLVRPLLLMAFLCPGCAWSEAAKKADSPPAQAAKQNGGTNKVADTPKESVATAPSIVNVVVSGKIDPVDSSPDAKRSQSNNDWRECIKTALDLILALATIAIAIYTARLFGVTRGLLVEARNQFPHFTANAGAAKIAAEAAQTQASALLAGQRARIFAYVIEPKFSQIPGGNSQISILFENHGGTVAIVTKVSFNIEVFPKYPKRGVEQKLIDISFPSGQVIPVQISDPAAPRFRVDPEFIAGNDFELAKSGKGKLLAMGYIEYRDVFDKSWETGFCWEYILEGGAFFVSNNDELNYRT
jgi:hypothetical protein